MSKASLAALGIFVASAIAALVLASLAETALGAFGIFFGIALVGSIVSERVFRRLASPQELREELEDRVRNSD